MRIIGVDPGTYNMGVGVIDGDADDCALVRLDVLKAARGSPPAERLHRLYAALLDCIAECQPQAMAIEEPFVARNVRSAMAVGQAQAIAMLAAAACGVPVHAYAPSQVKQSVAGHGGSSKQQVRDMVGALLGLDAQNLPLDASDALAVALCHINAGRAQDIAFLE